MGLNYNVYSEFFDRLTLDIDVHFAPSPIEKLRVLSEALARPIRQKFTTTHLVEPVRDLAPAVLFLARTWEPNSAPEYEMPARTEINDVRAECILKLRDRFGPKCIAGFAPEPYALANYPDLISPVSTDRASYIKLLREFPSVCIATTGLHGSIGWKLAEYVAFSKAIISEPLNYRVPGFKAGEHYLEFSDPTECADLVEKLISDTAACLAIRKNNESFYNRYLRPDVLVARTVESL